MTPLDVLLRDRILAQGPLLFSEFMRAALYHPEFGYYRKSKDPFGVRGDFYTASQLQPVFGRLIGLIAEKCCAESRGSTVVELGAGRREMAPFFEELEYIPIESGLGELPDSFRGFVLSNEFFDALPVDVFRYRDGLWREMRVAWVGDRFAWTQDREADAETRDYLTHYGNSATAPEIEICLEARHWIREVAARMECGRWLILDYGYSAKELARFPSGTLMSYRRHLALDHVLDEPGTRDITAHVCFDALADWAREAGLRVSVLQTMRDLFLTTAGETGIEAVLTGSDERERLRLRLQCKTLLFGLGETFQALLLSKGDIG